MPRIDLDKLVPEDIVFAYRGVEYTIAGDLDVEASFDLVALFARAGEAEVNGDNAAFRKVNLELRDRLLQLFQERDPKLKRLPFGTLAYRHVLTEILTALGFQVVEEPGPPKPRPKMTPPRSRPSSSSRRSSKGTAGRTKP